MNALSSDLTKYYVTKEDIGYDGDSITNKG